MPINDDDLLRIVTILYRRRRRRRLRRQTRLYVRPINLNRREDGEFFTLVLPMRKFYPNDHFDYLRMSAERYFDLLKRIGPVIAHADSHRFPISADERLTFTIRYLANGGSLSGLAWSYRIGFTTASAIIRETTRAIWNSLRTEFLKPPTKSEWRKISDEFWKKWNFPLCVGAVDGKHVAIRNPPEGASLYYNYKNFYSIVLLALVDADYKFIFVDIGGYGSEGDATLFPLSAFGQRMEKATESYESGGLDLPSDACLPGTTIRCPHVFLGDAAFGLHRHLMKPYSRRTTQVAEARFNRRLSRARRIVENGFGILTTRWRALETRSNLAVDAVEDVVKACVCLHNYLKSMDTIDLDSPRYVPARYVDHEDENGRMIPGEWRQLDHNYFLVPLAPESRPSRTHYDIRDKFKSFFMSDQGHVPRLDNVVGLGEY